MFDFLTAHKFYNDDESKSLLSFRIASNLFSNENMRTIFLVLVLIGIADARLLSLSSVLSGISNTIQTVTNTIGQTATNLWNTATGQVNNVIGNVVDSAGNVYGQLVNTANGVVFASNFLWDNVFGPAYDLFVEGKILVLFRKVRVKLILFCFPLGGQLFLDDKFGNIVSSIGRRSVLTENLLLDKFVQLSSTLKTKIHQVYTNLVQMQNDLTSAAQNGEQVFEERLRSLISQLVGLESQVNQFVNQAVDDLQKFAQTLPGDWSTVAKQYISNLQNAAKVVQMMIQKSIQNSLGKVIQAASVILPSALAIVDKFRQQELLSFLS